MTEIPYVVSTKWLFEHLEDPQLVIVDCRFSLAEPQLGQQQYQLGHITGAYYLNLNEDLSSPITEHGGRHPLPDPARLADKLSDIGVDFQKTLVVAYDDSRFAFASRLWWLLRYFGHEQVAVLDGGFKEWQSAGYPVTDIIPKSRKATFVPQLQTDMVVDITAVKSRKDNPGVVLVDSRESDRYLGIREPIDKIAGHIPGAVNYPWLEVTDATGSLRSPEEQRHHWSELKNAEEIFVYCGSGVTACVNLLSLEIAGIHKAKLYAGSWSDWISY
ncbi:sulfurtransferase [Aetokthonos hydrillicola Thurmond2011]|jgi:thiosulfate/3-mercaptopyruvate sulfurtransferase|uniref:Sulfurtransferase n=1 Tax=Aetokthonos hydrillicola Thurmond2011 TaxID=2712845 RepID=A0AAP5M850_9CYAN|nr:sulfurtransferase [Aetokthonos hydrillicola]MBO3461371.1 sulfurtransferase [Aetokthonos hydrillicola CCALA 1050]MBW4586807.1 sulfurtransferase [Aetokthonos hydrillicola CCALA 1050]MDR9895835.1 sulfurtransferase [Aetokthonos hydrillicola Thurmond2011]